MGDVSRAQDFVFLPRGGNDESRNKALEVIRDRQEEIEREGKLKPMVIFAEAGTTNGTHMVKFKKGAFAAEKRITPVFLKFDPF